LKKYQSNHFYFDEEGSGRGSQDIKKDCNMNCFDFFFFSVFLMKVMGKKITVKLKRTAVTREKKKHMHVGKELEAH
jgi:hypothetical protein